MHGDYSSAEGCVNIEWNIISGKGKKPGWYQISQSLGEISIDLEGKLTVRMSENIRRNYTINYLLRYAHGW